eukprot:tig00000093_g3581.t1
MAFAVPAPVQVSVPSGVQPAQSAACQLRQRSFFGGARRPRATRSQQRDVAFSVSAVSAPPKPDFEMLREGIKKPAAESILTPRFYTTDFEEMARMDISFNAEELEALNAEFRVDYNRDHFVRDDEFKQDWDRIDGETRTLFIEFLERSCTAEFSGFLLYKELARRLKDVNPVLCESFDLMSRDEARHAGFLNKALSDFNLQLDLGFLTKNRSYTYFKPKFIFYATYLSEKIGYWRYITIFKHLQENPDDRIYPIFKYFDNWCQDENRHGDFFDAVLRANPHMISDWQGRLWSRFFLLSVFATMYLNDVQRAGFYASIGLDARQYDQAVILKTNDNAAKVFPCILDVQHPKFFRLLDAAADKNLEMAAIKGEGLGAKARKTGLAAGIAADLLQVFLLPPVEVAHKQGKPL